MPMVMKSKWWKQKEWGKYCEKGESEGIKRTLFISVVAFKKNVKSKWDQQIRKRTCCCGSEVKSLKKLNHYKVGENKCFLRNAAFFTHFAKSLPFLIFSFKIVLQKMLKSSLITILKLSLELQASLTLNPPPAPQKQPSRSNQCE